MFHHRLFGCSQWFSIGRTGLSFCETALRALIAIFPGVCVSLICSGAFALGPETMTERASTLASIESEIDSGTFSRASSATRTSQDRACQASYRRLLARGQFEITIVYGYNDQRPFAYVWDSVERSLLLSGLTQPCSRSDQRLCGFSTSGGGVLTKSIRGVDGRLVQAKINLVASSLTTNDDENRTYQSQMQSWSSDNAREAFAHAIRQSDIVFYLGHARNGGGPDFSPPVLTSEGKVDLAHYQRRQEGLQLLMDNLAQSRNLKVLGLFACLSDRHFGSTLTQLRPDLGFFLAGEITTPTPMNYAMWGALHSMLGLSCRAATTRAITVAPSGYGPSSFLLRGFF